MKEYFTSDSRTVPAIVIQTDGQQTVSKTVAPPTVTNREELLVALRDSGVVGLGGAGFPTHVKFNLKPEQKVDYLLINGAECEPYVTSDTMTMMNRADEMGYALRTICSLLGINRVIIGIENNKKRAGAHLLYINN